MKLLPIKGLFEIDYGSPSPMVISNDTNLLITFYANKETLAIEPTERNTIYDKGIVALNFRNYLKYSFGIPSNETIEGHPYHKLGMESCSFYELRNSDLIQQLETIEKSHPYFNAEKWQYYRHYILTFHDNMFECVAKEFEIKEENISLYEHANQILNDLSAKQR